MLTNEDCLRITLAEANRAWTAEWSHVGRNTHNRGYEGNWSLMVIEPVLEALGWRRGRKDNVGTGAYFEWPSKHKVDVALFDQGHVLGVMELKLSVRAA